MINKNSENPLVSVIIPCFNDHQYIQNAIDSINNQTYQNVEIIIVDDGSGLPARNILKRIEQDNLLIIYQDNKGPSCARNRGISAAKGEFILTLDADDFFEPCFLSKAVRVLNSCSITGLVTCNANVVTSKGNIGKIHSVGGSPVDLLKKNGALASCLFRKQCWRDVGGYDENMRKGYEDWEFNISISKIGWKIYVIKEYLFNYRKKENSRNKLADNIYKYDLLSYIHKKHWDIFQENYEEVIDSLFLKMKRMEREITKMKSTSTYRLATFLISPFKLYKGFRNKKTRF